jgi:hypothetical protein
MTPTIVAQRVANGQRSSDDVGSTAEALLPQSVREKNDGRRPRGRVGRQEQSAQDRPRLQHLEQARRKGCAPHALGRTDAVIVASPVDQPPIASMVCGRSCHAR